VIPRAGQIVNLALSRCQRLLQGVGVVGCSRARRNKDVSRINYYVNSDELQDPRARAQGGNDSATKHSQRAGDFSYGRRGRGCTLFWHDYQRASPKPVPPFLPSLRHHVSPRAEQIVNLTHLRCQRLSQGGRGRGVCYTGTIINEHHVSPSVPSRRTSGIT
jgi:hypothetical protein